MKKAPRKSRSKSPNQPLVVAFWVLAGLAGLLLIVVVVVSLLPKPLFGTQTADQTRFADSSISSIANTAKKPFTNLDKTEAIDFLTDAYANNTLPQGLFDPRLAEIFDGQYISLAYSYDDQPTFDDGLVSSYGKYDTEILPIDSTFAVYYAVENDAIVPGGFLDLAFDQDFLDYHPAAATDNDDNSSGAAVTFTNLGDSFLKKALPLLSVALYNKDLNGIYDYEFEYTDHALIFTTYNISVGLDTQSPAAYANYNPDDSSTMPYAINLYTTEASVNLNTGAFEWLRADDGSIMNLVTSYPVKSSEIPALMDHIAAPNSRN